MRSGNHIICKHLKLCIKSSFAALNCRIQICFNYNAPEVFIKPAWLWHRAEDIRTFLQNLDLSFFFFQKSSAKTNNVSRSQENLRRGQAATLRSLARLPEKCAFQIYSSLECLQRFFFFSLCSWRSCNSLRTCLHRSKAASLMRMVHLTALTQTDLSSF